MYKRILIGLVVVLIALLVISCSKFYGNPHISFITGPGFTGRDTMISVNSTLKVSLQLDWNGIDALDKLEVKMNDATLRPITLIWGLFNFKRDTYAYDLNLIKSGADKEKWTFVVIDEKANQAQISLTLIRDPGSENLNKYTISPKPSPKDR